MKVLRTVCPIRFRRLAVQLLLCCVADKALIYNETDDDPDSKSSPAEAEAINLIILEIIATGAIALLLRTVIRRRPVIPADKLVEINHIALKTIAERAADYREGLE